MSGPSTESTQTLLMAAKVLGREISLVLGPFRLAPAQFAVLDLIGREGELRPSVIARKLDIESSTTTNTINRCERDGFLTRDVDPNNSKSVNVRLTEKGKAILEKARAAIADVEKRSLAGIPDEDVQAAKRVMMKMADNLK
jgi:DNA-binding MarR family transcriptional regulator